MLAITAVAAVIVFARSAHACVVPPLHLATHHAELVSRTDEIAWAVFEQSNDGRATFRTIESLKGSVGPSFTIAESPRQTPSFRDREGVDFDRHRDWVFWSTGDKWTRQWNSGDCRMHPVFERGGKYLVFLNAQHWQAYERVEDPGDRWLAAVRLLMANPSAASGVRMTARDYVRDQRSIYVARVGDTVEPMKGPFLHTVSVDLRERIVGAKIADLVVRPPSDCCKSSSWVVVFVGQHGRDRSRAGRAWPPAEILPLHSAKTTSAAVHLDDAEFDLAEMPTEVEFLGPTRVKVRDVAALWKR